MKQQSTKAELAKQLGVSRAYVTMLVNRKGKPSKEAVNKLRRLAVNNTGYNISSLTLISSLAPFTRSRVRIASATRPSLPITLPLSSGATSTLITKPVSLFSSVMFTLSGSATMDLMIYSTKSFILPP